PHALQDECGNAVACRRGIVSKGFGAMHEGLMIVRSEEESAGAGVREMQKDGLEELTCEFELCAVESGLLQLEDGIDEEYVVVEVRVKMCAPVFAGRQELPIGPELVVNES